MIGNENDAAAALRGEGRCIGDGSARECFVIDNVVYKIERCDGANDAEWDNYQKIISNPMSDRISIPVMDRILIGEEIIIAAEYIDGIETGECIDRLIGHDCQCLGDCLSDAEETLVREYIYDTAWGNVMRVNNMLCIIDLEC